MKINRKQYESNMDTFELSKREVKDFFEIVLEERCTRRRKTSSEPIAPLALNLVKCITRYNDQELLDALFSKINYILHDCEIFFDMKEDKAVDAMQELAHYACLFVFSEKYSITYFKIDELITKIKSSYPCPVRDLWYEAK